MLDARAHPLHERAREWVVFSDLHCSSQTIEVSRQVLRRVNDEAARRQAGIIFLGDFWHLRGPSVRGPALLEGGSGHA